MCLIAVSPIGTDKYSEFFIEAIKGLVNVYDDGCGFAIKKNDLIGAGPNIYISKGYFEKNADKMLADIKMLNLNEGDELIVHGRSATCGLVNDTNCHPFVISNNYEEINITEGWVDKPVMAHNGYIDGCGDKVYSDTFEFVKDIMSDEVLINLLKKHVDYFEAGLRKVLGWSKLAFLFPDRDMITTGTWEEYDDYFFSNGGFRKPSHKIIDRRSSAHLLEEIITNPKIVAPSCVAPIGFNVGESKQLKLDINKSTSSTLIDEKCECLILNDHIGDINHTNWDHFYFIVRTAYGNDALASGTRCVLKEIHKPGSKEAICEFTELFRTNENGEAVGTGWLKHMNNIRMICDIIPKPEYYEQYEDFMIILNRKQKSNSVMKNFRNILNKNHKEHINIKGIGHTVKREAVELVMDRWEDNVG